MSTSHDDVYRVDVVRTVHDGETWWGAEGGLKSSSMGVDFESSPDIADLMEQVADEAARQRERRPGLTVQWTLDNGAPDELLRAAERAGVELPK